MDLQQKRKITVSTILSFALLTAFSLGMPYSLKAKSEKELISKTGTKCTNVQPTVSITMLESILKVSVEDETETIEHVAIIEMYSDNVKLLKGCGTQICLFDLKHLSKGIYKVIIDTNYRSLVSSIKLN